MEEKIRHRVVEIAMLLCGYKDPYITQVTTKNAKVYSAQTVTEPCITCFVYESEKEDEERSINHISPFSNLLIFPEYYIGMSNEEILKDVEERKQDYKHYIEKLRQNRYEATNKKLDIILDLDEISEQEYYDFLELIEKSNVSDKIKKAITRSKWEDAYNKLAYIDQQNHYKSPFR